MGVGDFLGQDQGTITYRLTEVGKMRVEQQEGTGFELGILKVLDQHGPSTPAEVARHMNTFDTDKVKFVCKELKKKGIVA